MDAIGLAIIAAIPNFAGFVMLALSNNRTINRLFATVKAVNEDASASAEKRIIVLETQVRALEAQTSLQYNTLQNLMFLMTSHSRPESL